MRQYNGPSARPLPVDRNLVAFGANIQLLATAPHAATQRQVYTAPANKKVIVWNLVADAIRVTVAAPVGLMEMYWRMNATNAVNARIIELTQIDNTVGANRGVTAFNAFDLQATESASVVTADGSTGGTYNYNVAYTVGEYDA